MRTVSTDAANTEAVQEHAQRRLRETHEYARHVFNVLVSWFTFFITINYASMGWLAGKSAVDSPKVELVQLISYLFISQNILGVAAEITILYYLLDANRRARSYEQIIQRDLSHIDTHTCIPIRVYAPAVLLMSSALLTILIAWCMLPSFF